MRLIAWNCNERFDRNFVHLRDLNFDVAVVTECGPFEPGLGEAREVSSVLKLAVEQPRQSGARQHDDNVDRLKAHGLVSAFTAARGDVDPLTEPTLYHQWRAERQFHIDHVFVPKDWTNGIEWTAGTYDAWVAARRSDHVPITVDLLLPEISAPSAANT